MTDFFKLVTEAVTKKQPAPDVVGEAEPVVAPGEDPLDIPLFLRRSKEHPPQEVRSGECRHGGVAYHPARPPLPLSHWSDLQLQQAAESSEITLEARQPIYRERLRREETIKTRERIAKMKANLGER